MRVDEPKIALLEKYQKILVLDEFQTHNDIVEWIDEPYPLDYIALVRKDADVFQCWVVFPQGEDLGLIGRDGDRSSERGNADQHVLVVETVKPLPEGVLRKDIRLEPILLVIKLVPIVVHSLKDK